MFALSGGLTPGGLVCPVLGNLLNAVVLFEPIPDYARVF